MSNQTKKKTRVLNPAVVLKPETKEKLDKLKIIPQEPYNDVIERIISKARSKGT